MTGNGTTSQSGYTDGNCFRHGNPGKPLGAKHRKPNGIPPFLTFDALAVELGVPRAWLGREMPDLPFLNVGRQRLYDLEAAKARLREMAEPAGAAT